MNTMYFRSAASILLTKSEESLVFASFWKLAIVGPSANDRLAWDTTANYMDFLP